MMRTQLGNVRVMAGIVRVELQAVKASRSFRGVHPDIEIAQGQERIVPLDAGAEFVIPTRTAGATEGADDTPQPPVDEFQPEDGDYEPALRKFFRVYEPNKIPEVEIYLEHYRGREEDMMATLKHRFMTLPF